MTGLTWQALQTALANYKKLQEQSHDSQVKNSYAIASTKPSGKIVMPSTQDIIWGLASIPEIGPMIEWWSKLLTTIPKIWPIAAKVWTIATDVLSKTKPIWKYGGYAYAGIKWALDYYRQLQDKSATATPTVDASGLLKGIQWWVDALLGGKWKWASKWWGWWAKGWTTTQGWTKIDNLMTPTTPTPTIGWVNLTDITPFKINPSLSTAIKSQLGTSASQYPNPNATEKMLVVNKPTTGVW